MYAIYDIRWLITDFHNPESTILIGQSKERRLKFQSSFIRSKNVFTHVLNLALSFEEKSSRTSLSDQIVLIWLTNYRFIRTSAPEYFPKNRLFTFSNKNIFFSILIEILFESLDEVCY